jgi:predicted MFS family arabinose efflux permease
VLTLTVTGLVADATSWSVRLRRLVPIGAMLGGALAGGALLDWVSTPAPLWVATALLLSCAVIAYAATRRPQSRVWR